MEIPPHAQRFFDDWSAELRHEWLRGIPSVADGATSSIHLTLIYLVELHVSLQVLLKSEGTEQTRLRVLRRLTSLNEAPFATELSNCLEENARALAVVHPRPVRICGDSHLSYTHALSGYRERTSQLFGTSLLWHPDTDEVDHAEFVQNRRLEFERFRDREAGKSWRSCWDFVVENNNGCFTGRDLAAYEKWLAAHPEWNFAGSSTSPAPPPDLAPLSSKVLQGLLDISSETLRDYRRKAGLPAGSRGKSVVWAPKDVVALCDAIVRECPTLKTRELASQLKAKSLPDCQIS